MKMEKKKEKNEKKKKKRRVKKVPLSACHFYIFSLFVCSSLPGHFQVSEKPLN
jgi:hypothetical protein